MLYAGSYALLSHISFISTPQSLSAVTVLLSALLKLGIGLMSLGLLAIALDQLLHITRPLTYHSGVGRMCCYLAGALILCAVDIVAMVSLWDFSLIPIYSINLPGAYHVTYAVVFFVLPVLTCVVLQLMNVVIARRHVARMQEGQSAERTREQLRRIITNALVSVVLLVAWTPIQLTSLLMSPAMFFTRGYVVLIDATLVVQASFCLWVPLIYALRMKDIRAQIRRLFCCCCSGFVRVDPQPTSSQAPALT
jgi:hypothetical protein